eukprot:54399-Rhodomonas_salina.2
MSHARGTSTMRLRRELLDRVAHPLDHHAQVRGGRLDDLLSEAAWDQHIVRRTRAMPAPAHAYCPPARFAGATMSSYFLGRILCCPASVFMDALQAFVQLQRNERQCRHLLECGTVFRDGTFVAESFVRLREMSRTGELWLAPSSPGSISEGLLRECLHLSRVMNVETMYHLPAACDALT